MTRWILRGAALAVALLGALVLVTTVTYAERPVRGARSNPESGRGAPNAPLAATSPGYTLLYSFSSDPADNKYVASFAPDVKAIYAWAMIVEEGGAAEKQFTVDTQFVAPDGAPVSSDWYEGDTGTVTTYPADSDSFGAKNVARRFISIAGTPNAQLAGQWTVNYSVGGKLVASGNFALADAGDIAQGDQASSGEDLLTNAGYEVTEFKETKGKSGNLFAYTIMLPASQDLYSSDTTQQIVDGLAALRKSFPNSGTLYVFLHYDERYEVAYFADAPDVDQYLQDNDFDSFSRAISVDVWDNQESKYLGKGSKDFISKNFGAGTYSAPPNPPLSKSTNKIGSIRVSVAPTSLPADGTSKAIVSVTVYDKKNQPVPDAEVSFELTGSGDGAIRPRVTSADENGQADAVFTAGKKNGTVTVTASSGGSSGSGVITLGSGSTDSAADNVIAYMATQGLKATNVGMMGQDPNSVGVVVDLGSSFTANDLAAPIIYGMTALRTNYPKAMNLAVVVPYQANLLIFSASSDDYDGLVADLGAAQTDDDKKTAFTDFLTVVFGQSSYVDRNGNRISTFKDFYNKDFGGG